MDVYVVKKEDQRTDKETKGTVSRLLTNSSYHPRGIKVMLTSGEVGRVVRFVVVVGGQPRAETEVQLLPSSVSPALVSGTDGEVDEGALAMLVGEMDFDTKVAREALGMFDNNVERAVDYIIRTQGSE